MEIVTLKNSFKVAAIQASSFPEGVAQAHEQLKEAVTTESEHTFYGISHPLKDGSIAYFAAANVLHDDTLSTGLEIFTIEKGDFLAVSLKDWKNNIYQITSIFEALIADPRIDKNGYCLEEYINDTTLRCMVPMAITYRQQEESINLSKDIDATFTRLYEALSALDDETINHIPFAGSWTAGQVSEHIIKSISGIPDSKTTEPRRFHDQKVLPVKELFLNMDLKFVADAFLTPAAPPHDKDKLLETLKNLQAQHQATAHTANLEVLCLDMELPTFGYLTRYEWLRFMLFHTQRHTQQILNIVASIHQAKALK